MSLTTTVTTTATTELVIKPRLKQKLMTSLKSYQELMTQRKILDDAIAVFQKDIETAREEIGEDKLALDGFKVTRIFGTYEKLDKKKLVELGCAMAWIEEATELKPKKPYNKISCPGDRTYDE